MTRYGFSEKLGPIVYGTNDAEGFLGRDYSHGRNYSENIAGEIDAEIRELVETAYESARNILETHRDCLERVAQYLIINEKMDGEVFSKLMLNEDPGVPAADTSAPSEEPVSAEDTSSDDGEQI